MQIIVYYLLLPNMSLSILDHMIKMIKHMEKHKVHFTIFFTYMLVVVLVVVVVVVVVVDHLFQQYQISLHQL